MRTRSAATVVFLAFVLVACGANIVKKLLRTQRERAARAALGGQRAAPAPTAAALRVLAPATPPAASTRPISQAATKAHGREAGPATRATAARSVIRVSNFFTTRFARPKKTALSHTSCAAPCWCWWGCSCSS